MLYEGAPALPTISTAPWVQGRADIELEAYAELKWDENQDIIAFCQLYHCSVLLGVKGHFPHAWGKMLFLFVTF